MFFKSLTNTQHNPLNGLNFSSGGEGSPVNFRVPNRKKIKKFVQDTYKSPLMQGLYSQEEILIIHPTHMCTPMHIHAHTCTPTHPPRTPMHTHTHQPKLVHTPHIPTDALNLINHMKLHVNGKMAEERKKKEGTRVR